MLPEFTEAVVANTVVLLGHMALASCLWCYFVGKAWSRRTKTPSEVESSTPAAPGNSLERSEAGQVNGNDSSRPALAPAVTPTFNKAASFSARPIELQVVTAAKIKSQPAGPNDYNTAADVEDQRAAETEESRGLLAESKTLPSAIGSSVGMLRSLAFSAAAEKHQTLNDRNEDACISCIAGVFNGEPIIASVTLTDDLRKTLQDTSNLQISGIFGNDVIISSVVVAVNEEASARKVSKQLCQEATAAALESMLLRRQSESAVDYTRRGRDQAERAKLKKSFSQPPTQIYSSYVGRRVSQSVASPDDRDPESFPQTQPLAERVDREAVGKNDPQDATSDQSFASFNVLMNASRLTDAAEKAAEMQWRPQEYSLANECDKGFFALTLEVDEHSAPGGSSKNM